MTDNERHHDDLSPEEHELFVRLLRARGPAGEEQEVRRVVREALEGSVDEIREDAAGNLIALLDPPGAREEPVALVAHLDEIAMIVKRITSDGRLEISNLGGDRPMSFGQCEVEVMADNGPLAGVLSLGSLHRSQESPEMAHLQSHGPDWQEVFVITGKSREALRAAGVHPGSRIVLARGERRLIEVGELYGGHFMDDRALILSGIIATRRLSERRETLRRQVQFVCSSREETTNAGAMYAMRRLPGEEMIALEVGPVAAEYDTRLTDEPIISYGDQKGHYDTALIAALRAACDAEDMTPQLALLTTFASDASAVGAAGIKGRVAVICIPTQNTHGFEVISKTSVRKLARVLVRHVAGSP